SYYDNNGILITQKLQIIKQYIKNEFLFDIIELCLFIISYQINSVSYLSYFIISKKRKINKIITSYEKIFQLRERGLAYSQFLQLFINIILVSHYSACIFHSIAQIEQENKYIDTWLTQSHNQNTSWIQRYITCFYWSVVTMVTIGYGDIVAYTEVEKVFTIIMIFISCSVFAYSINLIGEQVKELNKEEVILKGKISRLNKYMYSRGLNLQIQEKVRRYCEYVLREETMSDDQEAIQLINSLSKSLKEQVWLDLYQRILNKKSFFKLNFSKEFLQKLSLKMKERKIGPEEYIYQQGDNMDCVFFILSGEADQVIKKDDKQQEIIVNNLKKGCSFGQLEFFSQQKRISSIRTKNSVQMAFVQFQDFKELLKEYEQDNETYNQIKDQINIYNNIKAIYLQCPSCGEYKHTVDQCYCINFYLNKDKLIIQNQKNQNQIRDANFYRQKRKFCTQKGLLQTKQQAFKFIVDKIAKQSICSSSSSDLEDENFSQNRIYQGIFAKSYRNFENLSQLDYTYAEKNNIQFNMMPQAFLKDKIFKFQNVMKLQMESQQYVQIKSNQQYSANSVQYPENFIDESKETLQEMENSEIYNRQNVKEPSIVKQILKEQVFNGLKSKSQMESSKFSRNGSFNQEDKGNIYEGIFLMEDNKFQQDLEFKDLILKKQKIIKNEENCLLEYFDKLKNFQFYFIHNNFKRILRNEMKRKQGLIKKNQMIEKIKNKNVNLQK
ncbi:hypothetical protein IMG5_060030, partial [Ichthyophthirius multifiliis]